MALPHSARTALVWLPACLATAACGSSTDPASFDLHRREGDGVVGEWVHSGLYNRTYYMHIPPGMGATGSHPLLIVLHGAGDTGKAFHARIAADALTDAAGLVVVYPDGLEGTWTVGCGGCTPAERLGANDVTFLRTLVHQLATGLPVDSTRVFVAGFSQGGQLAQVYGCQSPVAPVGIAVVSGSPYQVMTSRCAPAHSFPVAIIHGDNDPVIPFTGANSGGGGILPVDDMVAFWSALEGCDPTPTQEEHPDSVGDGTSYTRFLYAECDGGATVLYDRVNGGGHSWPGDTGPWPDFTGPHSRNLDASAEIVALFMAAVGSGS
ncbi:MAG: esterase [Gemmatimonadetes bacterium]|nr:esterase [Gemmatimonadota bacterium]